MFQKLFSKDTLNFWPVKAKALFGLFFFITQFPSLITHHFKYYTCLALSLNFHHSIFFTLFVGLIPVTHCRLFFFFLFFLFFFFLVPKLTEPSGKKKKKKDMKTEPMKEDQKKKKKPIID